MTTLLFLFRHLFNQDVKVIEMQSCGGTKEENYGNKLFMGKALVKFITEHEWLYCGIFQKNKVDQYEFMMTISKIVK